jgi:hypothetical protein
VLGVIVLMGFTCVKRGK